MKLIISIVALAALMIFDVQVAQASPCSAQFSSGLAAIRSKSKTLRPACWSQMQKKPRNDELIKKVCGDQVPTAMEIGSIEYTLRGLCHGECRSELSPRGLCIDGRPLSYYLGRMR